MYQHKFLGLSLAIILITLSLVAPFSPAQPSKAAPAPHQPKSHLQSQPQDCSITFADLNGNIFASYIYDLACAGVVNGIGGGYFGPGQRATRAQFAKMTALGFGVPAYTPATPSFTDVSPSYFAYTFIETLRHAGISSGYTQQAQCQQHGATAPCYLPNRNISRAEATALVMRAGSFQLINPPTPSFNDVPTSFFAYQQIETARSLGIVSGLNGYFRPNDPIRRDELCRVLDVGIHAHGMTIYDDALAANWDDQSWDSTRDFADTGIVYAGSHSLAVTYDAAWGALALHHASFSLSGLNYLHFFVNGGASGGQNVTVSLADGSGNYQGGVALSNYISGGSIPANEWREVFIPLSDIAALTDSTGFALQDGSGGAQATFYLDNISLTATNGTPQPTPTPTQPPAGPSYYRGVNLSGGEFSGTYPGVYGVDYRYPIASDFEYFHIKGLNFIRLPLQWERVQRSLNSPLNSDELARLDAVVGFAAARNMYVMFEPQNFDRYQVGGVDYLVGSPQVPDSAFADFWSRMAQHFAGNSNVSYDLMNEPHDTGEHWPTSAQAAVDAIRLVDTTHTIYVPGDCWEGAWTWLDCNANLNITDTANNLVYTAHQYFDADGSGAYAQSYDQQGAYPNIGVERLQPFLTWLQQHNYRGFVGEYGVPRTDPRWNTVLDNFLTAMDNANLGGTYWSAGWWEDSYLLSVQPWANTGADKPQMPTLLQHLGHQ